MYFTIEGNIGCGKSTILKIFRDHFPSVKFLEEPVEDWRNVGEQGVNILHSYYQNNYRWGLTFLQYALYTRLKSYKQARKNNRGGVIISERSPLSDKFVFFELMKDLNILDEDQQVVFQAVYKGQLFLNDFVKPKIIYLKSTPQICKARAAKRQRSEEAAISLAYFVKLHQKHEEWIEKEPRQNVLVIDTSVQFEKDQDRTDCIIKQLEEFIGQPSV